MVFSFDKAPLIGAAKYANMSGADPGLGRWSTLLPEKFPPGYLETKLKTLDDPNRKVEISRSSQKLPKVPGSFKILKP